MLHRLGLASLLLLLLAALPTSARAAGFGLDPGEEESLGARVDALKRRPQTPTNLSLADVDGAIVSRHAYEFPSFEDSGFRQTEDIRRYYETVIRGKFEASARTTELETIQYRSDGLRIRGFILRPKNVPADAKLPILIFNHGGNRDYGSLGVNDMTWLSIFAQKGYVALASQYRGCGGEPGSDEFGGADVHDVLNLITAAKTLPGADASRVFMMGHSRGGMETYLAAKSNAEMRAVAVMAGECDLKAALRSRPEMETGVYEEIIPGYAEHRDQSLRERSACSWPESIPAPVYILHGSEDQAVDPAQAGELAHKLAEAGHPYKLEMFPGGGHNLWFFDQNAETIAGKIDAWFRAN